MYGMLQTTVIQSIAYFCISLSIEVVLSNVTSDVASDLHMQISAAYSTESKLVRHTSMNEHNYYTVGRTETYF